MQIIYFGVVYIRTNPLDSDKKSLLKGQEKAEDYSRF
jgi:hypothetical protein